jgi:hypothetical protein
VCGLTPCSNMIQAPCLVLSRMYMPVHVLMMQDLIHLMCWRIPMWLMLVYAELWRAGPAAAARAAADAAVTGAASTQSMAAGAGRASYVPGDVLSSTPDPGAHAVGLWLSAVAATLAK